MTYEDFISFPWIIPVLISGFLFISVRLLTGRITTVPLKSDAAEHQPPIPPFFIRTPIAFGRNALYLLPILIAAALLRFPGLYSDPLNHLEQMYLSTTFESDSIVEIIAGDVPIQQSHQPCFSLLLLIFGFLQDNPESFRYVSVFLSLLSIMATYYLGALLFPRFLFGRIFMSTALAFSQLHVMYSKDITPYALFFLLSTISFLLFFEVMKGSGNKKLILFGCVSIITFYTHYYEIWILSIQVLIALAFLAGSRFKAQPAFRACKLLKCAAWIHLLMVPWYPCFVKGRITSEDILYFERLIYQGNLSLLEALREILRIFSGLKDMAEPMWVVFFLIMLFGLFLSFRRDRYVFASIFIPIITGIGVDTIFFSKFSSVTEGGYHFGVRHYIFMLPFFHATLSESGYYLARLVRDKFKPVTAVLVGGILLTPSFESARLYGFNSFRPDIKTGAEFIADNLRNGDAVVVLPAGFQSDLFGYYFPATKNPEFSTPRWHSYENKTFYFPVRSVDIPLDLMLLHPQFNRIWLVRFEYDLFNVPIFSDKTVRLVRDSLSPGFRTVSSYKFRKLTVELFDRVSNHTESVFSKIAKPPFFIDYARPSIEQYFFSKCGVESKENIADSFCSILIPCKFQSKSKATIHIKFHAVLDAPGRPETVRIKTYRDRERIYPLNPDAAIVSARIPCQFRNDVSYYHATIRGRRQLETIEPDNPLGIQWIRIIPGT